MDIINPSKILVKEGTASMVWVVAILGILSLLLGILSYISLGYIGTIVYGKC